MPPMQLVSILLIPVFLVTCVDAKIQAFQILQHQLLFVLMPQKFAKQILVEILDVKIVQVVSVLILHLFVTLRPGNVFADQKSLSVIQIFRII